MTRALGKTHGMYAASPIDYLNPNLPAGLRSVVMPVVDATPAALTGYGYLVDEPQDCRIEIVQWPAQGSRPVDADTDSTAGRASTSIRTSGTKGCLRSGARSAFLTARAPCMRGCRLISPGSLAAFSRRRFRSNRLLSATHP